MREPPEKPDAMDHIVIHGARQHNLKNIHLTLPRFKFIVFTGVSGSGKSSLAFDTLFAEGQRRYIEALSTQARLFLQQLNAPRVDDIQGLSPAIAIEQKGLSLNPRSTVGTLTEIHDYLRLLFAKLGTVLCPTCGIPIRAYTVAQILREIFAHWPEGSRLLVLAPLGSLSERELPRTIKRLVREGFARIRLEGTVVELEPLPRVPRRPSYRVEVVVDRLVLSKERRERLTDSFELAAKLSGGWIGLACVGGEERLFSQSFRCTGCGYAAPELTPGLFSFHHPLGMCAACKGLGVARGEQGDAEEEAGTAPTLSEPICSLCSGTRLSEPARSVRLAALRIHEVSRLPIPRVLEWLEGLTLSPDQMTIASRPVEEIRNRLNGLQELGLSYLTLDRAATTLSGGEAQRIRLAQQIGNPLCGVLYVLDEPSIGLHPRDHERLLAILFRLRDAGNTLIVVEHDRETIERADYVVDIGPGAGPYGGEVLFAGPPAALLGEPNSLTGQYLSGRKRIPTPPVRRLLTSGSIRIVGARGHNLKAITVDFPLAAFTCVTGVSGSGKSTLVLDTLYRALAQCLYRSTAPPAPFDRIEGIEAIEKVILIDQLPIGRTPRSTPATFTGTFDLIRQIFAQLPEARARGYGPGRFSFNARGGRCEVCKGEGLQRIEMLFLPDVYVICPECGGMRYSPETLEILFKGHSIASVLDMTVHEAVSFFESFPALRRKLDTMLEVGLGYLRLGQPATTLSGGEAQRIKLARELSRRPLGRTLYILDEPTTGLHLDDIQKLLHVLQRLVDLGHMVIVIEHHPDVIKTADYVIDLGPEGGDQGGEVVAAGTPEDIAGTEGSLTGKYLLDRL